MQKQIVGTFKNNSLHWVGDGFPVRSLFSYDKQGEAISPFLLLDFAGSTHFEPTTLRRGVGKHPHRGMETVTIVYEGEVSHGDSIGNYDTVKAGDVQWMTAAGGIVHEEYHSEQFGQSGGTLKMVQLWVNLPAKDKMNPPSYQSIASTDIPAIALPNNSGKIRVIAGNYLETIGPASTHSPMNVWDITLHTGSELTLNLPENHTNIIALLDGSISVNYTQLNDAEIGLLSQIGTSITLKANKDTSLLILTGKPLNEPIVGHGPFVMNSMEEIKQAFADYRGGKF